MMSSYTQKSKARNIETPHGFTPRVTQEYIQVTDYTSLFHLHSLTPAPVPKHSGIRHMAFYYD